ncbi:MAG TPA: hypothetical protein VFI29_19940 [Hanamia sp.]|nr:hypothetical protein [Hanamia sp.]
MTNHLNPTLLRDKLEEKFMNEKERILLANKYCEDGKSFLANTYLVSQSSTTHEGTPKYRVVVFEDLSTLFAEKLSNEVKTEINNQGFECEILAWSSYDNYVHIHK